MNSLVLITFKPCFCGVARETAVTLTVRYLNVAESKQAVMFLSLACVVAPSGIVSLLITCLALCL